MHWFCGKVVRGKVILSEEELRHEKVRRIREGERACITDGEGRVWLVERKKRDWEVLEEEYYPPPPPLYLAIPLIKPQRIEWAIEKGTELGVREFLLFEPIRGVGRSGKEERWRRIIKEAAKQAHNPHFPEISFYSSLEEVLDAGKGEVVVYGKERGGKFPEGESFLIVVGPEGGFELEEERLLVKRKAVPVSCGWNTLRTETAAIALLSIAVHNLKHKEEP